MNEIDLRPLWNSLLEIYEVVRGICQENHLRFYAAFGTALGAVRHKGFIPWDDDFDILMPRVDYKKFFEVAPSLLPPHLKIVSQDTMPTYPLIFGKIQETRREVVDEISSQTGHSLSQGIFVDIFPFDGVPDSTWLFDLQGYILRLRANVLLAQTHETFKSKVGWLIGKCLFPFYPSLRRREDFNRLDLIRATKIPFDESSRVGMYSDLRPYQFSDIYQRDWFDDIKWLNFETTTVPVPIGVNEMLTVQFGDYMKLPPPEKRHFTHVYCPPAPWRFGPVNSVDND